MNRRLALVILLLVSAFAAFFQDRLRISDLANTPTVDANMRLVGYNPKTVEPGLAFPDNSGAHLMDVSNLSTDSNTRTVNLGPRVDTTQFDSDIKAMSNQLAHLGTDLLQTVDGLLAQFVRGAHKEMDGGMTALENWLDQHSNHASTASSSQTVQ